MSPPIPGAVRVHADDPDRAPSPPAGVPVFPGTWSDELDAAAARAIEEKTAGVVASFGQPPSLTLEPSGLTLEPAGLPLDPSSGRALPPKSYEALCVWAEDKVKNSGAGWRIDVVRDQPKDQRYRGLLGAEAYLSNEQFAAKYGGGEYSCTLLIERAGANGVPLYRPETTVRFFIPGQPKMISPPPSPQAVPASHWPQESDQVAMIRAKSEAEEKRMLLERAIGGNNGQSDDARYLTTLSEASLKMQAEAAERNAKVLQRQIESKDHEITTLRDEMRRMREEHLAAHNEYRQRSREEEAHAAQRVKEAREEAERSAEARWESRMSQAHAELRMEREAKDRIVENERDLANKRIDMEASRMREETRLVRAAAERELEREKLDRAREIDALKSSFETRLNSEQRSTDRDVASRERIDQVVQSQRQAQVDALTSEVARLRSENESLRAQVYKPFAAQVRDFQAIAPVLGYTHASEQETPEGPLPEPPKSLVEQVIANAPTLLRVAGPAIAQAIGGGMAPPPIPPPPPPRAPLPPAPVTVTPAQPPPGPAPLPTVVGGASPVQVPTVVPSPRRRVEEPPPPPPNEPPRFEALVTPAIFRPRSPNAQQPASPQDIVAMLGLVTGQAQQALADNTSPAEAAAQVRALDPETVKAYTDWVDATNALVLLAKEDGVFWGREDAREWFATFWAALSA